MKILKQKILCLNNKNIYLITITNDNNYSISFYNYGGYINSILIPYNNKLKREDVIIGYNSFNEYKNDKEYFNCIIGRTSGRINNAKFTLNKKTYILNANNNKHHLHGGKQGFNKKIWKIDKINKNSSNVSCSLSYDSSHLEEGYPGNLKCYSIYTFNNKNEFIINFKAISDQDTIINFTNHNYWNFHGHKKNYKNIIDHKIMIKSSMYCDVNSDLIPSGKILNVNASKYNFKDFTAIKENILKDGGIDTCYKVDNFNGQIKHNASIYSEITRMGVKLFSNQPGIQLYTGNMMKSFYNGKYKKKYGKQYALCLEPQIFPNAINHKNFISPIVKANKVYSSKIIMKLKNDF